MKRLLRLVLVSLLFAGNDASAVTILTLAVSGGPVPGAPGETFAYPRFVRVSREGHASFAAADSRSQLFDGVWVSDANGGLAPVVAAGETAPGAGAANFVFPGSVPLQPGRVGVNSQLFGPGIDDTNQVGAWLWDESSGLAPIFREGEVVPGTNGAVLADPGAGSWTRAGDFLYTGTLVGGDATPANDVALLRSGPNGTSVLLREGDPAPGLPGYTVQFPSATALDDDSGRLLVPVAATHPSAGFATALYQTDASGALELLVAPGDPAPGFPGATFRGLRAGSFAQVDRIAFAGEVDGGGFGDFDRGIWVRDASGALALAVREGDAIEGGFAARDVGDADPMLDAAGRIVFEANAVNANFDAFSSILLYEPGQSELELVARVDTPIPGLLDFTFGGFFRAPQLNARGEIAFYGGVRGPGIPLSEAIYARLADGSFVLIARGGQSVEVAPGVFKTVENVNLIDRPDARFLSDDGRLVYELEFTDRTAGVFMALLPEPGTAVLALLGLAGVLVARATRQQPGARGHR